MWTLVKTLLVFAVLTAGLVAVFQLPALDPETEAEAQYEQYKLAVPAQERLQMRVQSRVSELEAKAQGVEEAVAEARVLSPALVERFPMMERFDNPVENYHRAQVQRQVPWIPIAVIGGLVAALLAGFVVGRGRSSVSKAAGAVFKPVQWVALTASSMFTTAYLEPAVAKTACTVGFEAMCVEEPSTETKGLSPHLGEILRVN